MTDVGARRSTSQDEPEHGPETVREPRHRPGGDDEPRRRAGGDDEPRRRAGGDDERPRRPDRGDDRGGPSGGGEHLRRPGAVEQVGLALRAYRREHGLSQRALAEQWGMCQSTLARIERRAGEISLDALLTVLARAGWTLAVVGADGQPVHDWERTDLVATDRGRRRFPAHRAVRPSPHGPTWWWFHEYFGGRAEGPQPEWTAEGFPVPEGTRYGKEPRPYEPGEGLRWPYG